MHTSVARRFSFFGYFWSDEETAKTIKSDFYGSGGRRGGQLCVPPFNSGVGVWEQWSRLNTLTLTKQPKINTVDWGYNNTQQPLLPATVLADSPSGPHRNKKGK